MREEKGGMKGEEEENKRMRRGEWKRKGGERRGLDRLELIMITKTV